MWNPDKIELLKNLWAAGHSAGQIAAHIGNTRSAVCAKLQRLGLNRGHKQPTAKPKIVSARRRAVRAKVDLSSLLRKLPSRRKLSGQPRAEFTKSQLQSMLAEAVRNTG